MNLSIYWTDSSSMLAQMSLPQMIKRLPYSCQARAFRYKSEISASNYVAGRILLQHGLDIHADGIDLEKLTYENSGKPLLPGVAFNISHSDHQVICAFANVGRVGVDIEKIKPIDFSDFDAMFSEREWDLIKGAENPLEKFYWFWTRKESIIKALGLTLSYLHQIHLDVTKNEIVLNEKRWFLKNMVHWDGYLGAVCSEQDIESMEFVKIVI